MQETSGRQRSFELGDASCKFVGKNLEITLGDAADKQGGYLDIELKDVLSKLTASKDETIAFHVDKKEAGVVRYSTYSGDDRRRYSTPEFVSRVKPSACSFSITRLASDIGKPAPSSLTLSMKCTHLTLSDFSPLKPADEKYLDTKSLEITAGEKRQGHILCRF